MPRNPGIHILSPFDCSERQTPEPDVIPASIVRALISGLLSHLWALDRRNKKEMGIPQEEVEGMLWAHVQLAIEAKQICSEGELIEAIKTGIPPVFDSFTGHTYFLLAKQSDLVIKFPDLGKYSSFTQPANRFLWLKEHLGDVLVTLGKWSPCTECRMRTYLPPDASLKAWARTNRLGRLRDNILAWFHNNMSASTVKRLLATHPNS